MPNRTLARTQRFSNRAFGLGVFICMLITVIAGDSWKHHNRIVKCANASLGQPALALDRSSPTGYELGMRRLVLPLEGIDGLHWIMHAQNMLRDSNWRVRWTTIDNHPHGRAVHWSHGFLWLLIGCGTVHAWLADWPVAASVEQVAPYVNVLLLALIVLISPWIFRRQLGVLGAAGLAGGLIGVHSLYEQFMVGMPDHHGLVAIACMFSVLLIGVGGAGWITDSAFGQLAVGQFRPVKLQLPSKQRMPPNARSRAAQTASPIERHVSLATARRYFVASGLAGSVGLWISAATTVPVLVGIGLGALASCRFGANSSGQASIRYVAGLWRWWGVAGCAGSLVFYLLEYFPGHMALRLEVNHPLYGLAWLGGAELIARVNQWVLDGIRPWQGSFGPVGLAAASLAIVAPPMLIGGFAERSFWIADPFLWNLHRDYINEFNSVLRFLEGKRLLTAIIQYGSFLFIAPPLIRLLLTKHLGNTWKGPLMLVALPGGLITLMGLLQFRWLLIANSLWVAAIPLALVASYLLVRTQRIAVYEGAAGMAFTAILLVANPALLVQGFLRSVTIKTTEIGREEYFGIYLRDYAYNLRRSEPQTEPTVVSGPTSTTYLMYYGGMKGLGTLYWENLPGLKATAEIYATQSDLEAFRLFRQHAVTYLALFQADAFALEYTRLHRALPRDAQAYDGLVPRLLSGARPPGWLKPTRHQPVPGSAGNNQVFEIDYDLAASLQPPSQKQ
ncbi:MAG: hypothetical protein KF752_09110 [Pirellulaceae bacterium]|nr:hypothetical protein [Pirellulaceae bacterium]